MSYLELSLFIFIGINNVVVYFRIKYSEKRINYLLEAELQNLKNNNGLL